jgi:hypothetical protein
MTTVDLLGIELFNSVWVSDEPIVGDNLLLDETVPHGFILQPEVAGLHNVKTIIKYLKNHHIEYNQTFHKSWDFIERSSEKELLAHKIMHYFSTYGMKALGLYSDSTIYIPNEVLEVPEIESLPLKVIKGLTKDELITKCLGMLESGVALKVETIESILTILKELGYEFSDVDNIKNKEAKLMICELYDILPKNNTEFMRYLIYKATGKSIIINNPETFIGIRSSQLYIQKYCEQYSLDKLSESFLRYKKLFMAFKAAHPDNAWVVNKLRRLARKNHKPMSVDYLNNLTGMEDFNLDELNAELDKVNVFRKIRVLHALHERMINHSAMVYKIRNGKSFVKELNPKPVEPKKDVTSDNTLRAVFENAGIVLPEEEVETPETVVDTVNNKFYKEKYDAVYAHILKGIDLSGVKIKYPTNINYVLPTSEKQFVGNIPSNSYIDVKKDMVFGIYWENAWGAEDLDLALQSLEKIGWNAQFKDGHVIFSGDVTSAPTGASECFYVKKSIKQPYLIVNNIFEGTEGAKFRFFVAKEDVTDLKSNYMVNPNNILFQTDMVMDQRQKNIGVVIPHKKGNRILITDYSSGSQSVSSVSKYSLQTTEFFVKSSSNKINLKQLLSDAGCEFVEDGADIDLSVENLEKDTIMNLLIPSKVTA